MGNTVERIGIESRTPQFQLGTISCPNLPTFQPTLRERLRRTTFQPSNPQAAHTANS